VLDLSPLRRTGLILLALCALVAGTVLAATSSSAVPPGCTVTQQPGPDGKVEYVVTCPGGETGPGGGTGGSGEPGCTLTGIFEYCIGASACWANVPSALDPATWPEETRPSPEAIYTYQQCSPDPTGTLSDWSWYEPPGPSLTELAQQAYGALAVPAFGVGFNPPGRTVVGIPTWFWADTAQGGQITGSSALGVIAIGTPDRLEVDPGDGSGTRQCPWTTEASAACSASYARSSAREPAGPDGRPAYTARIRLVYDVRYENNGVGLTIIGLPTTLTSPWVAGAVPVAEVQSVVTSKP